MGFNKIASLYNHFNDLNNYYYWLDFTMAHVDREAPLVLELACGTGWFTHMISPHFERIIALDIDHGMLEVAFQNLKELDNITLIQGDMRDLDFPDQQFEVILCYMDALCFLKNQSEVQQALNEAYRVLKPGGKFLFDVITPFMVEEVYSDFEYFDRDESTALLWGSRVESELTVYHDLTTFVYSEAIDAYKREDVTLVERTYELATYFEMIRKAGFKRKPFVYIDYGMIELNELPEDERDTDRWFFVCEK